MSRRDGDADRWPPATTDTPGEETIELWCFDGVAEATDGCEVEPDGVCEHGHPAWTLRLGVL